jgi:hypothetical protein
MIESGKARGALRRLTQVAFLLSVSVVVGLVVLEVVVRLIEPREVMRYFFMTSDSVLHHRFIPGASGRYKTPEFDVAYTINSLGLRDREISRAKAAGTRRILMLGDSFTEGDGVEYHETFSARLQGMIDTSRLSGRWEVINGGVGSYAPVIEHLFLLEGGLVLQPDIVVLNLDLSDFFDDLGYSALARYDEHGVTRGVSPLQDPPPGNALSAGLLSVKDFFKENTRLYNFVRLRIDRYLEGARHTVDMSGDLRFDKYAMLRPGNRLDLRQAGAITFGALSAIHDTLAALGVPLLVTVYPYGLQVCADEWVAGRQFWGFKPDTVYGLEPQEEIARICAERGIAVADLCAPFREQAGTVHPLYHDYNGHWVPAGHEIIARELYTRLLPELQQRADQP